MKKNVLHLKTIVIALVMLYAGAAQAFTAVTSGNWSSAATWGGVAPGSTVLNNDIIIPSGITVTLDTDVTFTGLVNTFNVNGILTSTTKNVVITQGIFAGSGTVSIHRLSFTGLATATFGGTINADEFVNSTSSLAFVAIANISDSLILESGSITLNANSNLSMMTGSTIKVNNGAITVNGGVLTTTNNYNLMYVGTSKTAGAEFNSTTAQNLTIKMNSNSQSVTLANNTTINNNLAISSGMLSFPGKKVVLKGDLMLSGGGSLSSDGLSELQIEGMGALSSNLVFAPGATIKTLTIDRPTTVKLASGQTIVSNLNILQGTLSLEMGAALTMSTMSTVHIENGSLVLNSGSFIANTAYNVEYMGSSNTSAGAELSGTGLNNVTINISNTGSVLLLSNSVSIFGTLTMTNGHLNLNGQNLTLNSILIQNPSAMFIGNANSEMVLNLTSATNTGLYFDNSSAANQTLSKLKLNLSGAGNIMLASKLMIKNELNFVKGKLMIDNSDLVIMSGGSIVGYDDTRYVVTSGTGSGRLQMNVVAGASSFLTFPVGSMNNFSPAHIQQASAASSGNFMVKAMDDVLTGGYSGFSAGTLPVVSRTWFIDAESGVNVNMSLKLGWMAAAELNGFNRNNATIRHFTNGSWDTYTYGAATASSYNTFELTRTGITSLSPFAVADNSAPLKVAELSTSNEFDMYPNPAKEVVNIKLNNTADICKYELIDITGKTVSVSQKDGNNVKLNVADLQPGCYFIKITNLSDESVGVKRLIKN